MRFASLACFVTLTFPSLPALSAELIEGFDGSALDTKVWNPCQTSGAPLTFEALKDADGTERRVLRNVVNGTTGNVDECPERKPIGGESASSASEAGLSVVIDVEPSVELGPSLIEPSPLEVLDAAECPKGDDHQRNELRLQIGRSDLVHGQAEPHWYSITFRADGNIPSCGSARWILAQWKQKRGGGSPFLAQRFDNGVLHVTVQNDGCRCAVAQSAGDFDAMIASLLSQAAGGLDLEETKPIRCVRTDLPENAPEQSCEPVGLKVLTLGGGSPPQLPDPKRNWVQMTYFVRGGADGRGQVDVYADGKFVVRVLGLIGYSSNDPGDVKFKFGHYRDRIPGSASMSVDRVCLSRDVKVCAPDIAVVP